MFKYDLKPSEASLFRVLFEQGAIPLTISQDDLTEQLADRLIAEKLLREDQRSSLEAQSDYIALFAISRMHLCEIALKNGKRAWLEAAVSSQDNETLVVNLHYRMDRWNPVTRIFKSNLRLVDSVDERLMPKAHPGGIQLPSWNVPFDLTADGKLVPFGPYDGTPVMFSPDGTQF